MARYAATTKVSVSRSKAEIEDYVERRGATGFMAMREGGRNTIAFLLENRQIRFTINTEGLADQEERSMWRGLFICIKAKFASIDNEIETFDEAFMPHIVMPNGQTVGQMALPEMQRAIESNEPCKLLPEYAN